MITVERSKPWQQTWLWALALGLGAGVAVWWVQARVQSSGDVQAAKPVAPAGSAAKAPLQIDTALLVPPTVAADGRPSDFSPEDWAALREAMAKTSNPKAEMERVVKYLRFQKGFEQWQQLLESSRVAERHQLAERLLAQVPDRMRAGELTMGEALMLESALWADLEPNEAQRKQKLEQAQSVLASAAPQPDPDQAAHEAEQLREYKRREAAILADYQGTPEPRDPNKLSASLDAARNAVFSGKK